MRGSSSHILVATLVVAGLATIAAAVPQLLQKPADPVVAAPVASEPATAPAAMSAAPPAAPAQVTSAPIVKPSAPSAFPGATPETMGSGQAGMLIGIDPETGQLGMPTPEQVAQLRMSSQTDLNFSSEGLQPVYHADGSISLDLQGRFQEYAVVTIGADGKPVFRCLHDHSSIEHALHHPDAARPALEDR